MGNIFVNQTTGVLAKVLDGSAARQRVLADNIANVETPGYLRKTLPFEGQLREAISRSGVNPAERIAAIERINVRATEDTAAPARADGNTVQIEREMVEVAKNAIQYETAAQLLSMRHRALKSAIHDGRR